MAGVDLRKKGDLHIALWRKVSPFLGIAGVLVDLAKGATVVLGARALGFETWAVAGAGLAAVVGQMWPPFLLSTGGRGNSTAITMVAALAPGPFLIAFIPMLMGVGIRTLPRLLNRGTPGQQRQIVGGPPSRSLPLGMIIGFAILPLACWMLLEPVEIVLVSLALLVAIVLRRLTVGLRDDLGVARSRGSLFLNRLLYDRSFL
jgi:hypothetical protein